MTRPMTKAITGRSAVLIVAVVFVLGMLIYLPFWRLYVKHYQEEMGEETEA